MSAPIVERLRAWPASEGDALSAGFVGGMMAEAATAITDLLAALEGLLPTALCGESWGLPDNESVSIDITFGKLKTARAALAKAKGDVA